MQLYRINYKKLVVLLLPTMLRKSVIITLLQCATIAIRSKHTVFLSNRDSNLYRVQHTGQVCYLRAVLNDAFPVRSCDFEIEDSDVTSEFIYALSEVAFPYDQLIITTETEPNVLDVWGEGYILVETTPFLVECPPELYADTDSMNRIRNLVNAYKLLSKRAVYGSL